jgi:hypothetical protein
MPVARSEVAACVVGSDIYAFGEDDEGSQASAFKFDTVANTWSELAPTPLFCYHRAVVLDGLIYFVGAHGGTSGHDVLRLDPASGEYSFLAPTLLNRSCRTSFVLGGCLYAAGGMHPASDLSVERYDVVTDTWTTVTSMTDAR